MWFKNISAYRLTEPLDLSPEQLAERLGENAFRPPLRQEPRTLGWVAPQAEGAPLVHAVSQRVLICLQSAERLLPAAVVNEVVAERLALIEADTGSPVRRRDRLRIKDEVIEELLPQAFIRHQRRYAFIDLDAGWLVVNNASQKGVTELIERLRRSLGELAVEPLPASAPEQILSHWLQESPPPGVTLGEEVELRDPAHEQAVVRCKGHSLDSPEILNHLDVGKVVTRVAIDWHERLSGILGEDLCLRRLRFGDVLRDTLADQSLEDAAAVFDAEYALMSAELVAFLTDLQGWFAPAAATPAPAAQTVD